MKIKRSSKQNQEIVHSLEKYRMEHRLTQGEMGAILGITQQHYSRYENGITPVPLSFIDEFKRKTGYDLLSNTSAPPIGKGDNSGEKLEIATREIMYRDNLIIQLKKQIELLERLLEAQKSRE